jgi:NAD(P) transhydrogenase subunit alpha
VPYHASQLYSKNVTTLLAHLSGADGRLAPDRRDEIVAATLLTHAGKVVHPAVRALLDAGSGTTAAPAARMPAGAVESLRQEDAP